MHEYSIVQALYDQVMVHARTQGVGIVQEVRVRIGEMSGVDVGLLDTAWRLFRVRTPCEGAAMRVETVSPRWECPVCATTAGPSRALRCDGCGGPLRLAAGDEIVLDQIVLEVP